MAERELEFGLTAVVDARGDDLDAEQVQRILTGAAMSLASEGVDLLVVTVESLSDGKDSE